MTASDNLSPETRRAFEALLEASAEMSIETLRERLWMFPAFGVVFGSGFFLIGVMTIAWHGSLEMTLFGMVFIIAGVFAARAMASGHRKASAFLAFYDEKLCGTAEPSPTRSVWASDGDK